SKAISLFSQKATIPTNILVQELGGEIVILNLDNESYYSLNKVGSKMWELLKENENLETITQQLLRIYNVEEKVLRQDIAILIDELVAEGLLTLHS
ncbi:MAG: PqqD family protein, partial [Oscillatoria sp. PMC 1076.18]|nr:PqqD family protein [Oscillatoria sp. PMC 1076.18]